MSTILVVAGVPQAIEKAFGAKVHDALKDRHTLVVWSPLPQLAARTYTTDYASRLYSKLHEAVRTMEQSQIRDMSALVAFVNYEADCEEELRAAFFPEIPLLPIAPPKFNFQTAASSKHVLASAANDIIDQLNRKLRNVRPMLAALKKELTSRLNKTALLLPLRHFEQEGLNGLLRAVEQQFNQASDPFGSLGALLQPFEGRHQKTVGTKKGRHFINSSSIIFQRPGTDLHAQVREPQFSHPERCFVSSRLRMGTPYDPNFHYDCTHVHGAAAMPKEWKSCHRQEFKLGRDRVHINIAPNGNCR